MSSRLHESLGRNKLVVKNTSTSEVNLFYPNEQNVLEFLTLAPFSEALDLTNYATIAKWKKSPNLADLIKLGMLTVLL